MRRIALALLSAAAVLSALDVAQARDGCGPGRFYDGYRCVRMGGPPPGYYGGPGYGGPGYYGGGPGYGGPRPAGPGQRYIAPGIVQNYRGEVGCARPGFTLQDGVCKPYRGY